MKTKHFIALIVMLLLVFSVTYTVKSSIPEPQTTVIVHVDNYQRLAGCNANITLNVNGFVTSLPYNGTGIYTFGISSYGSGYLIPGFTNTCGITGTADRFDGIWNYTMTIHLHITIGQDN